MKHTQISGIVAYPVTPFTEDGAVDAPRLEQLVDRLVAGGSHAIAPLGSTGESAYLSDSEWDEVAEISVGAVAGRLPTIVGIADLTTAGAVRRARVAERLGADAIMVLPLSYWKLSQKEIIQHFSTIAANVSLPIMAYNNPATAGIDMSPALLVELTQTIENVTMIKESSGDIARMQQIRHLTSGSVPFFNGSNPLALQAFAAGASGWCTAVACLIPTECLALYDAMRQERLSDARTLFERMLPLLTFVLDHGGLPTTVKAGLANEGFPVGFPRLPLAPLAQSRAAELAELVALAQK